MPVPDHYCAYLILCTALGVLRLAQALRWRVTQHASLSRVWLGLDLVWAVLSVVVAVQAEASVVQGTAIWFVLGTLAGLFLLRLAATGAPQVLPDSVTPAAPVRRAARSHSAPASVVLPNWYQEYLLCFGGGLLVFASAALLRYPPVQDFQLLTYIGSPAGVCWCLLMLVTLSRVLLHVAGSLVQRSVDRGVRGGLQGHPLCRELFGDIRQVICKQAESAKMTGDDVLVYRVVGSRAAGVVVAEFRPVDQTLSELVQGLVYLDSGERSSLNAGSARTTVPGRLNVAS